MPLTPPQMRAARALLEWSIDALAERAGIHRNTVLRAEKGEATAATLALMQMTLERSGVIFIEKNGGGEGVRLAEPSEVPPLVSRRRKPEAPSE